MISRTEVDAAWCLIRPHVRRTPAARLEDGEARQHIDTAEGKAQNRRVTITLTPTA